MLNSIFKLIYIFASTFLLILFTSNKSDAANWIYKQDADKFTDSKYSYAAGFAFDYKYNNDFTVSFRCSNSQIRFEINADTLINSKNDEFSFSYRVDKRTPREIKMRTYTNDGQGGYTYSNIKGIANDILGGHNIFVRAITWNNEYLDAKISLSGSDNAIKKVFSDCNTSLNSSLNDTDPKYSLNDFNKAFKKLTPAQQKELLLKLKTIMSEF